ncbi:MAG: chaperone modulator CbpM [Thermodesulfobacteriota bacterium]
MTRSHGLEMADMAQNYYRREQVIEILKIEEQFLDELEAEELVRPQALSSRERVFSPDQVERIRIIANLVRQLDVNLAGCEVILEMRENMIRMQRQFDEILSCLVDELKRRLS